MSAVQTVLSNPLTRTSARRLGTKPNSAEATSRARGPWLIGKGHRLAVPRLEEVPHHHSSFGSDAAAAQFGVDPQPFLTLLDIRAGSVKPRDVQPDSLFAGYIGQIHIVLDAVDKMEK